ncbi:MAG: hypothetical protein DI587_36415 [Variovorax paradoxus]|nr:MAG: hypothetical protein DI583_36415 [Variovorax paradoxus]PZQ00790.1 MAG: hypothetical protein DI587_36415 [Variovorax paradoxus]
MEHPTPGLLVQVAESLEQADASTRAQRASRIVWLGQAGVHFISDRDTVEKQSMRGEAISCYIGGQHIACLLVALAYIEHAVFDELAITGAAQYGDTLSFEKSLRLAKERLLLDAGLVDRADALRLKRNPYAHVKKPGHMHALGTRYRSEKAHPASLTEADAQEALLVLVGLYNSTLRPA